VTHSRLMIADLETQVAIVCSHVLVHAECVICVKCEKIVKIRSRCDNVLGQVTSRATSRVNCVFRPRINASCARNATAYSVSIVRVYKSIMFA